MKAYYNEIDPFSAQWLRNLIANGTITDGDVDTRSIEDVRPSELTGYNRCHFFAGIGVWDHALNLAGWGDERVWTGSCPCQPFSAAGNGGGFADERHLWPSFFHLIEECHPGVVFGEQVASAVGLDWIDLVCTDLEGAGYAAAANDLCAAGVGAPHIRQRLYWVGHANDAGLERYTGYGDKSGGPATNRPTAKASGPMGPWYDVEWLEFNGGKRRPVQPGLEPMAPRSSNRVGLCRSYGNAIVAPLAAEFIAAFMECRP